MIIEIKGVEFENKGAQLMLVAIIKEIIRRWPKAEFALTHSAKASRKQCSSVASFRKLNLRKNFIDLNFLSYLLPKILRNFLKNHGMVIEADVDMIIDASGFSYTDQWPSKIRIYHLTNELGRFHRYHKPYIFLPQAFGPFTTEVSRKRIGKSFRYAAMICAREQQSLNNLMEITGPLDNLFQYNDFTNLADGSVPSTFDQSRPRACIIPNKNMVNVRNANEGWLERYELLLAEVIMYYRRKGLNPFFLNHEGDEDFVLIDRVNKALDKPAIVIIESDPLKVKGIIGASRAVLSSRYHGCISALSQGIPCIGTSWSHKYELLYQQYRANSLLLDSAVSVEQLQAVIDIGLEMDSDVSRAISVEASELKARSVAMWDHFQAIAEQYPTFKGQRSV